jgi:hypothetical protein
MAVERLVAEPARRLFAAAAALERRWLAWLGGESPGGRK